MGKKKSNVERIGVVPRRRDHAPSERNSFPVKRLSRELKESSELAKRVYTYERRLLEQAAGRDVEESGLYYPSAKWSVTGKDGLNSWNRIAVSAQKMNMEVIEYVTYQFFQDSTAFIVLPCHMYGAEAIRRAASGRENAVAIEKAEWSNQVSEMETTMFMLQDTLPKQPKRVSLESVLWDESLILTPLFRYIKGVKYNLEAVVEHFYEQACRQYAYKLPVYVMILRDRVPKELTVDAKKRRRAIYDHVE